MSEHKPTRVPATSTAGGRGASISAAARPGGTGHLTYQHGRTYHCSSNARNAVVFVHLGSDWFCCMFGRLPVWVPTTSSMRHVYHASASISVDIRGVIVRRQDIGCYPRPTNEFRIIESMRAHFTCHWEKEIIFWNPEQGGCRFRNVVTWIPRRQLERFRHGLSQFQCSSSGPFGRDSCGCACIFMPRHHCWVRPCVRAVGVLSV